MAGDEATGPRRRLTGLSGRAWLVIGVLSVGAAFVWLVFNVVTG